MSPGHGPLQNTWGDDAAGHHDQSAGRCEHCQVSSSQRAWFCVWNEAGEGENFGGEAVESIRKGEGGEDEVEVDGWEEMICFGHAWPLDVAKEGVGLNPLKKTL